MNLTGPYDHGETVVFYDHKEGVEIWVEAETLEIYSAFEKRGSSFYTIEVPDEAREIIEERLR